MFLTTGALVLSRKISDKRARDKQAKQQLLQQDSSSRAKSSNDLTTITSRETIQPMTFTPCNASGFEGHYRDADFQTTHEPTRPITLQTEYTSRPGSSTLDTRGSAELSPRGAPPPYSPADAYSPRPHSIAESSLLQPDSAISHGTFSDSNTLFSDYSATTEPSATTELSATTEPSATTDRGTAADRSSTTDPSPTAYHSTTTDHDHGCLRIRTRGTDLKSGFPYAPGLFELRVHPELWEKFTAQVVEATKFSNKDYAQMVGAATATALTGALLTSVYVGRSMNHSLQEKKVKAGLENMTDGGLGDLLKQWNETEFKKLGIFVHLELSASALKRPDQRSPTISKHPLFYSKREDRERKAEERKFCLVVSHLDDEGVPADALEEVVHEAEEQSGQAVEAPNHENVIYEVPELPGDEGRPPVELPAGVSLGYGSDKFELKFAELDSTPITATDKNDFGLDRKDKLDDEDEDADLMPQPLMVTAATHAALHKEIT